MPTWQYFVLTDNVFLFLMLVHPCNTRLSHPDNVWKQHRITVIVMNIYDFHIECLHDCKFQISQCCNYMYIVLLTWPSANWFIWVQLHLHVYKSIGCSSWERVYFIHLYLISYSSLDNLSTIHQFKLLSEFKLDSQNSLSFREKLKLQCKYNASWLSDPLRNFQFSLNM